MTPEQLKAHIDTTMGQLKTDLTTQQDEIKKFGETTNETATKIAEHETLIETLSNDLKDAIRKLAGAGGDDDANVAKSLGQRFVESEEYKNMITNKSRNSVPFAVERVNPRSKYALTSEGTTGVGVASPPNRVPGFISPTQAVFRMRDLIPVHPTQQGSIEYVRTTGFFPVATYTTADTAIGDVSVPVVSSAGFSPGQPIMVGLEVRVVDTVPDATHVTVTVALAAAHAFANKATRVVSHVIAAVAQGELKPTGEFTDFTLETESIKTIPTSIDIARQALDDVQQLRAFVDNQLMFEMGYTEEYNLLYGTGSSSQLRGILTDADRQRYLWSTGKKQTIGTEVIKDTKIDAIRRAITLVQLARYPSDGIVIHPRDWEDIELMKGSDGHYLWLSLPNGFGGTTFFQYPVVVTDAIAVGQSLTGSFTLGTAIWDREQANIRVSEHHNDNFKRNLISLLVEERLAQTIYRPEAFVEIVFDSAPA